MSRIGKTGDRDITAARADFRSRMEVGLVVSGTSILVMADRVLRFAHVEDHAAAVLARALWVLVASIGLLSLRDCWSRQDLARGVRLLGRPVERFRAGLTNKPTASLHSKSLEIAGCR